MDILIRQMKEEDIQVIWATPDVTGHNRRKGLYRDYFREQEDEKRVVLLAFYNERFAGYVNIIWESDYPPFTVKEIPEISDLVVHRRLLRRGIATALVDEAERLIFQRSHLAGIAVGMYDGYGPAQIMYANRGYVPDGRGLMYHRKPVIPMEMVKVDDELLLYLIKERPEQKRGIIPRLSKPS